MSLATLMPPDGAFFGPASSLDNQLGRFDGTDGDTLKVAPLTYIGDDGHMSLGQVAAAESILEIWDDDAHPVFTITAAHDMDYDPQIQFRTDVSDTVKFSMGVDGADDCFKINSGAGIGGTTEFVIDINGNIKYMKADPYLNQSTNFFLGVGAGGAGDLEHTAGNEGWYNLAEGYNALYSITTGSFNLAQGVSSLGDNTTGYENLAQGYNALRSNVNGYQNIAQGPHSLYSNIDGNYNLAQGLSALHDNVDGYSNVAQGVNALYANVDGYKNIAQGPGALKTNVSGYGSIAIGGNALYASTGSVNLGIGIDSLRYLSTGIYNIGIGAYSLYRPTGTNFNVAIGVSAGYGSSGQSFSNSVLIGYKAGYKLGTSSHGNILLGFQVADNLTTVATRNIIIGYDIDGQAVNSSNTLSIGNLIFGTGLDGTGTTPSAGNIGIREPNPETLLEMTSTAPYTTWHNSTEEDGDGGRESVLWFSGEQSGGEETHLGSMTVAHDGAADDQKGYFSLALNDGADGDSPTERLRIDSAGLASFAGNINIVVGKVYKINSTQVIGAQQAHIVDADGTLASATAQLNALLASLETHGLLANA